MVLFEQIAAVETRGPSLAGAKPLLILEGRLTPEARRLAPADIAAAAREAATLLEPADTGWQRVEALCAAGDPAAMAGLLAALVAAVVEGLGAPRVAWEIKSSGPPTLCVLLERPLADCGMVAAREAVGLLSALFAKATELPPDDSRGTLRRLCAGMLRRYRLPNFAGELAAAAEERGIPVRRLFEEAPVLCLGEGSLQRRFVGPVPPSQSSLSTTLGRRRDVWSLQLAAAGLPLAPCRVVASLEAAEREAANMAGPVALLRLERRPGEPLPAPVRPEALERRFALLAGQMGAAFLLGLPSGQPLRLLVVGGACRGIFRLVPGSGRRLEVQSTPAAQDPTLARLAERAAQVLGLPLLTLDMIRGEQGDGPDRVAIIDLDPQPDLEQLVTGARARAVARALVAAAFAPGEAGCIPSVGLLGEAAHAVAPALAQSFADEGLRVGEADLSVAQIAGRRLGSRAGLDPRAALLGDRDCDLALLSLDPASLRMPGLPLERLAVALLSAPAQPDRLWRDVLRLTASATARALVLDQRTLEAMGAPLPPSSVLLAELAVVPRDFAGRVLAVAPAAAGWRLLFRPAATLPLQLLAVLPDEAAAWRLAWVAGALCALDLDAGAILRRGTAAA